MYYPLKDEAHIRILQTALDGLDRIESAKTAVREFCEFASEGEIEDKIKELKALSSEDKDTYNVINKFIWLLYITSKDGTVLSNNSFKLLNAALK